MPFHNSKLRRVLQWGDVRQRKLGFWAYVLNRLSGLGLVLYLYLHLFVLRQLAEGPAAWDSFVATVRQPIFLMLDVVLLVGLLVHGLNGVRVTLTGLGFGVGAHKALFIGLMGIGMVVAVLGAWLIFRM